MILLKLNIGIPYSSVLMMDNTFLSVIVFSMRVLCFKVILLDIGNIIEPNPNPIFSV